MVHERECHRNRKSNKPLSIIIFTFAVNNAIVNIRILGSFEISHSSV